MRGCSTDHLGARRAALVRPLLTGRRMKNTLLFVVSALWLACPPAPMPPPVTPCDQNTETCPCGDDSNCGPLFFCDPLRAACIAGCTSDDECNTRPTPLARCEGMGCWCEFGECVTRQCSSDADCAGQACRDAVCGAQPADTAVARCEVQPDFVVVQVGDRLQLDVLAWNTVDAPHVSAVGPTWSAPSPFEAITSRGNALTVTVGAATGALPDLTAQWGSVSCRAQVLLLPTPAAGEVVVSVVDDVTGRPLAGARVLVSDENGAVVPQNGGDATPTDSRGVVVLSGVAAPVTISVFDAAYGFQTIANTSARTVRFFVRRNPLDTLGGVQSTFNDEPRDANVHLARAGLSTPGDVTTLELTDDGEPTVSTDIRIGTALSAEDTPVPVGTFLSFGGSALKPTVSAFGVPGVCSGVADGTCGTQSAWALTGNVPLGSFPIDLLFASGRVEFMPLLLRMPVDGLALGSSVVRDAKFTFVPTPGVATGQPDLTATSHFARENHVFAQVRSGFLFGVRPPTLPRGPAGFPDQVISTGAVHVGGRGLIPLGFGVRGNIVPADGEVDALGGAPGQMLVRMAPAHHGLEGRPYELITVARWTQYRLVAWLGRASSTVRTTVGDGLTFAPEGTPVDQRGALMLSPPTGRFDFAARRFTAGAVAGANVMRVTFVDRTGAKWDVLVDAALPEFVLPMAPVDLLDRVFADGARLSVARSKVTLLSARHGGLAFDEVVSRGASERSPSAWAQQDVRPLAVVPLFGEGASLGRGAKLEASVEGFQLGVDGALRISFPGAICPAFSVTQMPDESGLVPFSLPSACAGRLTVRMELVDVMGQPLVPAVASELDVVVTP